MKKKKWAAAAKEREKKPSLQLTLYFIVEFKYQWIFKKFIILLKWVSQIWLSIRDKSRGGF